MVEVTYVPDGATADRDRVESIARGAFPTLQAKLVHMTDHVLAARHEGEIVGGTINEVFEPTPDRTVGLVTWIFTDPAVRGLHAGEALLESTIEYLENQGCDTVIAIVRWNNTSSSKLFASHGFSRTTMGDVVGSLGVAGTARSWWTAMYWPALGFDLWTTGIVDQPRTSAGSSPVRTLESLAATTMLFLVAAVSLLGLEAVQSNLTSIALLPVGFFTVRWLPRWLATMTDDEPWTHWPWGNVYPFTLVLAAFGLFVQLPGNRTPRTRLWTYREHRGRLGSAAALSGALMVTGYAVGLFHEALPALTLADPVAAAIVYTGWFFLATDVLLIGFPFNTYGARTIFDWNRTVWAVLAVTTVGLFAIALARIIPLP